MIHRVKTASAGAFVAAALLAGLAPAIAEDGPKEPAYTYSAEVVDVIDGDTVDVHVSLGFYVWIRYQRIKLAGIDAPDATAPGGEAAKAELEGLIGGKTVILQSIHGDDDPARRDSFGNWLGLIWVDGKSVNDAMIESGNAVKTP
jgi:endonuclease YncB( thermonuclease family)